eukprot:Gb_38662 [translate_table: standard]
MANIIRAIISPQARLVFSLNRTAPHFFSAVSMAEGWQSQCPLADKVGNSAQRRLAINSEAQVEMNISSSGVDGLGVVHTIYEEQEELYQSSTENTSNSGRLDNPVLPSESAWIVFENGEYSPLASDATNNEGSLQRIVWTWCETTGIPTSVTVHIMDRSFELHKFPLVSRSGYFKRELMEANEIYLSSPGGAEVFELVAAYCYGSAIIMGPSNIAAIRCAAELFEMTEEYCRGNLCKRSDLYFKDVILKNWDDAIEVLRSCQELQPIAGELAIVGRCVEALALMGCSEIINSAEKQTELPWTPLEFDFGAGHMENTDNDKDWLVNDLLKLPFGFFGAVIEAIRRQGRHEKFIGRAMILYVDRWVFDMMNPNGHMRQTQFKEESERKHVVEAIVSLLPVGKDIMPVSFLFGLLRCVFAWKASTECRAGLELRIAGQLEQATVTDFLLPLKTDDDNHDDDGGSLLGSSEIDSMQQIVHVFMSQQTDVGDDSDHTLFSEGNTSSHSSCSNPCVCNVAKIWDEYLTEIALYPKLSPAKFMDLVETVPSFSRPAHDQLYKAIHIYLKTHPQMSDTERLNMCKTLNCQKLSQEICIHAVQNDFMPLRMIVQAMYMHQLQGMQPPSNINRSFRSSSLRIENMIGNTPDFNFRNNGRSHRNRDSSLGFIFKRDAAFRQAAHLKSDLEETNSRLKNLEEEITGMRKTFQGSFRKDGPSNLTPAEDFSNALKQNANLKKPRLASKACGGGGVAQKIIKSLQKLSLSGLIRKSKLKQTEEVADKSVKSKSSAKNCLPSNQKSGSVVELDLGMDQLRSHRRHHSTLSSMPVSSSSRDINVAIDQSKPARRRHHRSLSVS